MHITDAAVEGGGDVTAEIQKEIIGHALGV